MDFKATLDLITAGASIFGSLVIVFTALAAFRQLAHMRNANEISAFTAIIARWQTPDVEAAMRFMIHDLPDLIREPAFVADLHDERLSPRVAKMRAIVDLMDEIDVLLIQGILTERAVMMNYAPNIVQLWALAEPAIRLRRRVRPDFCTHFEDLAARATKWNATEQAALREQLRKMPDTTRAAG